MKRILCTGITGFIGRHVLSIFQNIPQVEIVAMGRCESSLRLLGCPYLVCSVEDFSVKLLDTIKPIDAVLHMAWADLDNYRSPIHIEQHLFHHYRFLTSLLNAGICDITVTGTCLEYGVVNGCLQEEKYYCQPSTSYALAKDSLRRFLEEYPTTPPKILKWLRLFYTYGDGQRKHSLIPLLLAAIERGDKTFPMSGGEQLRDYLEVTELARSIAICALQQDVTGIINCCHGTPRSVRSLVESVIQQHQANIHLELGHFPYPTYEGMAFWGNNKKIARIKALYSKSCGFVL